MFKKDDFASLQALPRFKKMGDPKIADLPPSSLVTAGLRTPTGSSEQGDDSFSGTSSQTLSLNVQFVVYHGQVEEYEDD